MTFKKASFQVKKLKSSNTQSPRLGVKRRPNINNKVKQSPNEITKRLPLLKIVIMSMFEKISDEVNRLVKLERSGTLKRKDIEVAHKMMIFLQLVQYLTLKANMEAMDSLSKTGQN